MKQEKVKEKLVCMVFLCKGSFWIGRNDIRVFVDVEDTFPTYDDFCCRDDKYIDEIANKALKESEMLYDVFSIDKRFFNNIEVEEDDCVEGPITDSWFDKKYDVLKTLDERLVETEYEGKTYKCVVTVCREWFEGEKHINS